MSGNPKLVLIEWMDSFGCSSQWQQIEDCKPQALRCKSVGWLIYDGDDCKLVVPHISDPEHESARMQGCGDMTIPTKAVISIQELQAHDAGLQSVAG